MAETLLRMCSGHEVIADRFQDELFHQERIETPIDGVPLRERVIHRYERRVLPIYINNYSNYNLLFTIITTIITNYN